MRHPTAEDWDHERDLRKHEPRPTDPLPLRLITPTSRALDVAVLVQGLRNPLKAAELIEQYAQTVASEACLQAVIDASDKIMATIEAAGSRP